MTAIERAACGYPRELGRAIVLLFGIVDGKCECGGRPGCKPGKHPRTPNGADDATTDPAELTRQFRLHPNANIGMHCGGLAVADVDPRNGGDDTLAQLVAKHGPLPYTPHQFTGGAGHHYVFRAPEGIALPYKLGDGLELVSGNRYIVVAPSLHISGRRYAWDRAAHPLVVAIAPLPEWITSLGRERKGGTIAPPTGLAGTSYLGQLFYAAHMAKHEARQGTRLEVTCPWRREHEAGADTGAAVLAPNEYYPLGRFICMHSHCAHRTLADVLQALADVRALTDTAMPREAALAARVVARFGKGRAA